MWNSMTLVMAKTSYGGWTRLGRSTDRGPGEVATARVVWVIAVVVAFVGGVLGGRRHSCGTP